MGKLTEKISLKNKIVIGLVLTVLLVGVIFFSTNAVGYAPPTVTLRDIFVDVNQDGFIDYIAKADVVLNAGVAPQANFQ